MSTLTERRSNAFQSICSERNTLKAQRDALRAALDFMYRYFVMPGHAQQAKECPNKNCPFCKAEAAIAACKE